ncbi:Transposase [Tindallia magadiensis]|uniref:Transposase n=1 Tax=Tindallia magadiensis TaxID=69895 RepID=A0A1I3GVR5_9FIRM|nr:helix-turn-helix domain-containing protein [Tindallia magadiensis]SFI27493.1 Transposase [Tindallia magadiensis]
MTQDKEFNAHSKHRILMYGIKEKNVAKTCRVFGISRTIYYRWMKAYEKEGMKGLEGKERKPPVMKNKIGKQWEEEILEYVLLYPEDGPKRIFYEMKSRGMEISESGIYKVLLRKNLTRKVQRRNFAQEKAMDPVKENKKKEGFYRKETPVKGIGDLMIQRIDYLGRFQGVGRVYQYTLYDLYSGLAVSRIFQGKNQIDIGFLLDRKIRYLLKTFDASITLLCSCYQKEFLPYFIKGDMLQRALEDLDICHQFIKEDHPMVEKLKAFQRDLRAGFYKELEKNGGLFHFSEMEKALEQQIRRHNFFIPIKAGLHQGKAPIEMMIESSKIKESDLESLPLWILALLDRRREEKSNG